MSNFSKSAAGHAAEALFYINERAAEAERNVFLIKVLVAEALTVNDWPAYRTAQERLQKAVRLDEASQLFLQWCEERAERLEDEYYEGIPEND